MVSAHLKTTFIKMVREYLKGEPKDWKGNLLEAGAKKLGYEVISTGDGQTAWIDALRDIWNNEEENSIILSCYSPYTSIPYYLQFIEEYTDMMSAFGQPEWTGSDEWKKKMEQEWKDDISTDKKRIKGVKIGIDGMGYEETSASIREDVTWKAFISWAGMNAMGDDFKTSIKGGWIFRKPIMIPQPYNLTLPPAMVKNLREAMKELKPTL